MPWGLLTLIFPGEQLVIDLAGRSLTIMPKGAGVSGKGVAGRMPVTGAVAPEAIAKAAANATEQSREPRGQPKSLQEAKALLNPASGSRQMGGLTMGSADGSWRELRPWEAKERQVGVLNDMATDEGPFAWGVRMDEGHRWEKVKPLTFDEVQNLARDGKIHLYRHPDVHSRGDDFSRGRDITPGVADPSELREMLRHRDEKGEKEPVDFQVWVELEGEQPYRLTFGERTSRIQRVIKQAYLKGLEFTAKELDRLSDPAPEPLYDANSGKIKDISPDGSWVTLDEYKNPTQRVRLFQESQIVQMADKDEHPLFDEHGFPVLALEFLDEHGERHREALGLYRYHRDQVVKVSARRVQSDPQHPDRPVWVLDHEADLIIIESTKKGEDPLTADRLFFGRNVKEKQVLRTGITKLVHDVALSNAESYQRQLKMRAIFEAVMVPVNVAGGLVGAGPAIPLATYGARLLFMAATRSNLPKSVTDAQVRDLFVSYFAKEKLHKEKGQEVTDEGAVAYVKGLSKEERAILAQEADQYFKMLKDGDPELEGLLNDFRNRKLDAAAKYLLDILNNIAGAALAVHDLSSPPGTAGGRLPVRPTASRSSARRLRRPPPRRRRRRGSCGISSPPATSRSAARSTCSGSLASSSTAPHSAAASTSTRSPKAGAISSTTISARSE